MIQEDGRKRELVVGVVRANHRPHKSAGECNDSVGYYTSDGHLLNACDKNNTKSAQPVEGSRFTLEYNNSYGSETGMLEFPLHASRNQIASKNGSLSRRNFFLL